MNFVNAIKKGYKEWKNFEGRASRSEFWYWVLFYYGFIAASALIIIFYQNISKTEFQSEPDFPFEGIIFIFTFSIISLFPYLAVLVRRLHDINQSGTWVWALIIVGFLSRIPIIGFEFLIIPHLILNIAVLILCMKDGDKKNNKYGKNIYKVKQKK